MLLYQELYERHAEMLQPVRYQLSKHFLQEYFYRIPHKPVLFHLQ